MVARIVNYGTGETREKNISFLPLLDFPVAEVFLSAVRLAPSDVILSLHMTEKWKEWGTGRQAKVKQNNPQTHNKLPAQH